MKAMEHRDAGNASGFGVSTRCARSPLRFDPSDDTPNPEAWKSTMAGRGLPAMVDQLLTGRSKGASEARLTSIRPAGNYRLSRVQNQSEYTLLSPSDCPTNQDHLRGAMSVRNDGDTLYLEPMGIAHFGQRQKTKLTHESAAEYYWNLFAERLR